MSRQQGAAARRCRAALGAVLAAFVLGVGLVRCSGAPAPPPGATPAAQGSEGTAPGEGTAPVAEMEGEMRLAFFDDVLGREARKPNFEVVAPECRLLGEGVWEVRNARATIHGRDGTESHITAGTARVTRTRDESRPGAESVTAELGGGVRLETGQQVIELQDLVWQNSDRVARSDKPLTLEEPGRRLTAQTMVYHHEEGAITLTGVSGTVELKPKDTT